MRDKGFEFDKVSETWERPEQTSKITSRRVNKMSRSELESTAKKAYLKKMSFRGVSEGEALKKWNEQIGSESTDRIKDFVMKNIKLL